MSIHTIKMPDIGEGIVEVELVAWHVKPGDVVREDQVVADVMTDKATVEIPSPVKGVVQRLGAEAGTVMRVGSALIEIAIEGAAPVETAAPAPAPVAAPVPAPAPVAAPAQAAAAPVAAVAAAPAPAVVAMPVHAPTAEAAPGARPIASPSVRRRAWELGVDLAQVRATGTAGRITHADVEGFAAAHPQGLQPGSGSPFVNAPGAVAAAAPVRPSERHLISPRGDGIEASKVTGLRRKIAEKMQESKRRIPHFSYVEEVDVTELEALRERLNVLHGKTRGKLTVLPLLVRAVCRSLRDFPQINARFDDEAGVVNRYEAMHLGIAAQTPSGLMVPVIRHAEALDLWSCAAEIRRLAEVARTGKATRDELSGSTFTISSLGPLGGIVTTPVINHPEVGILGVNRIVERPMFRSGQVVARLLMNLSSSFDHRVVDGQDAAEFIQSIRAQLEAPATLFID
ncbi:dihydrolipoamide acetyltransferase family protein [Pelomonas sp. APW6]|uniref:Dihydrolipoamide acetyltransferase component of pyruvate dehydrogenase complex n=1 Tax=Roseateles subflavus TaxID=3053353 RepID=A0ABT7LMC8_9BURK|nr:dihydrolipoamide acetyltransferase family protein [Pelomonas sp. APW6]MDL5033310.1 dihydrolipoamide acetyltransferase family protein [Pelomonas sp. APW6]